MLKPGTYKLETDVKNPTPDRRFKREWRHYPTWKAGWEFLVVENCRVNHMDEEYLAGLNDQQLELLREANTYTTIRLVGDSYPSLHEVGPGHEEQYAALAAALVPVPESHEAMFTRLGVDGSFAQWLVNSGKLSPALFEKVWEEYNDAGDDLASAPVRQRGALVESNVRDSVAEVES